MPLCDSQRHCAVCYEALQLHHACSSGESAGSGTSRASEAAPEAVQSALEGVSLMLPRVTPQSQAAMLEAVASLADRSPSKVNTAKNQRIAYKKYKPFGQKSMDHAA